jgi:hypothetical protein
MHSRCGCYNAQPPTCDVALGLLGLSAWSLNLAAEPKLLYATVIVICRAAEQVLQTPTRCQTPHCFVDRQQRHGASAFATTPLRSFAGCSRHLPGRRLGTLRAWLAATGSIARATERFRRIWDQVCGSNKRHSSVWYSCPLPPPPPSLPLARLLTSVNLAHGWLLRAGT